LFSSAILGVALLVASCSQNELPPSVRNADQRDGTTTSLAVTVTLSDGSSRAATVECDGEVTGTGYLENPGHSSAACVTILISAPLVDFLRARADSGVDPRSKCKGIIASAAMVDVPKPEGGTAEISGRYRGFKTRRIVDSNRNSCDGALWLLMQPLFTPSSRELVSYYPPGSD
jgi:hypothetical protein